jgi:peptidoglycan hydrolase-like protein with peptidoglycan-binding domain
VIVNDSLNKNSNTSCGVTVSGWLARGLKNNAADVKRLQQFLNTSIEANLPVTGTYGPLTQKSVIAFQVKSGIKPATGNVYTLTRAAINAAACGGVAPVHVDAPTVAIVKPVVKTPTKPKTVVATPKAVAVAAPTVNIETPKPAPEKKSGFGSWIWGLVH